ncbi:hypothetical protein PCORN_10737 [Listeria cornellensis FSL F6-0969]|uniref:Uncharacterized protein n=1 Tax=Listeria cornellensis FSL F6-0969 TaxID=1265820 RepID=W7C1Y8_9LIST|nr:hypothetical protein PCORN_10737 [Listeria cornellensis FSL F6-0969]
MQNDNVNQPPHYQRGGIETLDFIKAKVDYEPVAIANVIKYVSRYQDKNGLEDLMKAQFYLNDVIKWIEKQKSKFILDEYHSLKSNVVITTAGRDELSQQWKRAKESLDGIGVLDIDVRLSRVYESDEEVGILEKFKNSANEKDGVYAQVDGKVLVSYDVPATGYGQTVINWAAGKPVSAETVTKHKIK